MAGAGRERDEARVGTGLGQVMQDLVGTGEDLGFDPPGRWAPWRAMGRGGVWPDSGAHRRPLQEG